RLQCFTSHSKSIVVGSSRTASTGAGGRPRLSLSKRFTGSSSVGWFGCREVWEHLLGRGFGLRLVPGSFWPAWSASGRGRLLLIDHWGTRLWYGRFVKLEHLAPAGG